MLLFFPSGGLRRRASAVDCFSFYRSRAAQAAESKGGIIKLSFGRLAPPRLCYYGALPRFCCYGAPPRLCRGIEAKAQDTFFASIFY